jgi:hypothetical protein
MKTQRTVGRPRTYKRAYCVRMLPATHTFLTAEAHKQKQPVGAWLDLMVSAWRDHRGTPEPEWPSTGRWAKVVVHTTTDEAGLRPLAFNTACDVADFLKSSTGYGQLYYCRYTGPGLVKMEIKARIGGGEDKRRTCRLREKMLKDFVSKLSPLFSSVTVEECGGSDLHAAAFELARRLNPLSTNGAATTGQFDDVLHWLMNMTGHNYLAEIEFHTRNAQYFVAQIRGQQKTT